MRSSARVSSRSVQPRDKRDAGDSLSGRSIALFYLVTMVLGFIGIGLSRFFVVVAALNLVLDFDFIEPGGG